jgi:hypothetical protein
MGQARYNNDSVTREFTGSELSLRTRRCGECHDPDLMEGFSDFCAELVTEIGWIARRSVMTPFWKLWSASGTGKARHAP